MAHRETSSWLTVAFLFGCASPPIEPPRRPPCSPPASASTSVVSDPGLVSAAQLRAPEKWLVLGVFPNPTLDTPSSSGASRGGVDRDYLEPIGGEATAVITRDIVSRFTPGNEPIEVREANTEVDGFVELDRVFPKSSNRILYAYGELDSDRDQPAVVHFGVDDSAKVWVNGKLVHDRYHPGRPVTRWSEEFPVSLVRGKNRILIKVDNGWKGAGFVFEPFTLEAHEGKVAERAEQNFGEEPVVLADDRGFVRTVDALPELVWATPDYAGWVLGSSKLSTTWYGPDGRVAVTAKEPGLYIGIATYYTRRGLPARRAVPLLRVQSDFSHRFGLDDIALTRPRAVTPRDWNVSEPVTTNWVNELVTWTSVRHESGAIVLSNLLGSKKTVAPNFGRHWPFLQWQQSALDLKRNILGASEKKPIGPTRRATTAGVLHPGTLQQAGIDASALPELRKIANDWAKAEKQPFVLAVARHGVLFLHEAFGGLNGKPLPLDFKFSPASIGKNFAALVFAQFVERGYLKPEQVVGEVLSSWPRSGAKAVTFRQLFDHTAGLRGHTTFAGLDNPWLEETFAAHVLPSSEVGVRYEYEGDGGNIAAKAMELIDGRAFPIILRESLFVPLGATSIDQWDCGWAAAATTLDMAKVAQMLLQRGAYGDWQFFGDETWRSLLPVPLGSIYPRLASSSVERGLGLEHAWDPEDDAAAPTVANASTAGAPTVANASTAGAPTAANATEAVVKAKALHSVGHGSASSSIYRVDFRHDLVMVAGRISAPDGDAYEKHLRAFVRRLEAAFVD